MKIIIFYKIRKKCLVSSYSQSIEAFLSSLLNDIVCFFYYFAVLDFNLFHNFLYFFGLYYFLKVFTFV